VEKEEDEGSIMKLPDRCPACKQDSDPNRGDIELYWLKRAELDFDGHQGDDRIGDEIFECSICHTLFRARWKLISFTQLVEKVHELESHDTLDS